MEEVPTVDQYLSDLNLDPLLIGLHSGILQHHQLLSFPYSAPVSVVCVCVCTVQRGCCRSPGILTNWMATDSSHLHQETDP